MQLVTYIGARGFYLAPLGDPRTALQRRVSPYYATQERAEEALAEKRQEYLAANAGPQCGTCGRSTKIDCGICGTCAEDWNDRDQAAGLRRINRRRKQAGLPAIEREGIT